MTRSPAGAGSDDASVVAACVRSDEAAFRVLHRRHAATVLASVVGTLDPISGPTGDPIGRSERVWLALREERAALLARWTGEGQLRTYLAVVARRIALEQAANITSPTGALPPPSESRRGPIPELEARIAELLEKLPPNVGALVRLRQHRLSLAEIAATLGAGPSVVQRNLERLALRLAGVEGAASELASWRVILDVADEEERVELALRTDDDPRLFASRRTNEQTWRTIADRALGRPAGRSAACLDDCALASFVDGSMRGAVRARAEGHAATCPRCLDDAAALVHDLRLHAALRDCPELDAPTAVLAACVADARFVVAERLLRAGHAGDRRLRAALKRLAQAGRAFEQRRARDEPTSQVVAAHVPESLDVPLVALESLLLGDAHGAGRALEGADVQSSLGPRLRLLVDAAGHDLERARDLAVDIVRQPAAEPGSLRDARAVLALPSFRPLPREVLAARLRALLPQAVRALVAPVRDV